MIEMNQGLSLLCRVQRRMCAVPLEHVVETMRPLPVEPLSGAPAFVLGLALVRGVPVPIVDAARLFGEATTQPGRFVTLRTGARQIGLAVDAVLGIRSIEAGSLRDLPLLLGEAAAEAVAMIGTLDAELLLVLRTAHIIPDDLLDRLGPKDVAS